MTVLATTIYRTRNKQRYRFSWDMQQPYILNGQWKLSSVFLRVSKRHVETYTNPNTGHSWTHRFYKPIWVKACHTDEEIADSARIIQDWQEGRVDPYIMEGLL